MIAALRIFPVFLLVFFAMGNSARASTQKEAFEGGTVQPRMLPIKKIYLPISKVFPATSVKYLSLHEVHVGSYESTESTLLPSGWRFLENPAPILKGQSSSEKYQPDSTQPTSLVQAPFQAPLSEAHGVSADHETGLWLPLGELTPAAAFRSGDRVVLVVDGQHALDLSALPKNSAFGVSSVEVLETATVIILTVPENIDPAITPNGAGWSISLSKGTKSTPVMSLEREQGVLSLLPPRQDGPLRVMSLTDPASGRRLLLGLVRSGRVLPNMLIHGSGFEVRSSIMGVVVGADSDALELRLAGGRFVLDSVGNEKISLFSNRAGTIEASDPDAVSLTSRPVSELRDDYRHAWISATFSMPEQRLEGRLRAAKAAAALGNVADLDGALSAVLADWPEAGVRMDVARLQQISAALHHRKYRDVMPETVGNSPEDQFWRGEMKLLKRSDSLDDAEDRSTARLLAAGLPVAEHYPDGLRQILLPEAAEFIARNAPQDSLQSVRECRHIHEEVLACALLDARNNSKNADSELAALQQSTDPHVAEGAREELIKRSYESGKQTLEQTVQALDTLIPLARLVGREKEVRLAELKAVLAFKKPLKAEALIAEWKRVFPHDAASIRPQVTEAARQIGSSLVGQSAASRISFLKNALDQSSEPDERRERTLALGAQYEALGLPKRARDVLARALLLGKQEDQTDLRLRMARLDLAAGELGNVHQDLLPLLKSSRAAEQALPGMSNASLAEAPLLDAQAFMRAGDDDQAARLLEGLDDAKAQNMLVDIAEKKQAWMEAASRIQHMLEKQGGNVNKELSQEEASLTEKQEQLVLRAAEDISNANNLPAAQLLRARYGKRMEQGKMARMFDLLTGEAVALSSPRQGS